jgi:hypothetical protein
VCVLSPEDEILRFKSLPHSVRSASLPETTRHTVAVTAAPPARRRHLRDLLATIPIIVLIPALLLPVVGAHASIGGTLIASPAELAVLPTSGSAWTYLKGVADGDLGLADLTDQNNKHDVRTLAVAFVANRLNSDAYRAKARAAILGAMGTERVGANNSILALGRQLGAYVLAADLIGLSGTDDARFRAWLSDIRTRVLGGHGRYTSLKGTCEDSPHNWGTFACASLIAANLYLGDDAAVARSWAVFRGLTGDRLAYAGFENLSTDVWACPGVPFTPDNAGCPGDPVRYGAFVKDVTRGTDPPLATGSGLSYTLEILQGVALQAELLARAGHPDAWNRLRPAFDWARRNGVLDLSSVGYHVTWWANERLGWNAATRPAAMGRVFGFTDWLYGSPAAGSVPVPAATPKPTSTPVVPVPTPTPAGTPRPTVAPTPTPASGGGTPASTPAPTAVPVPVPPPVPADTVLGSLRGAGARIAGSSAAQVATATSLAISRPSGVVAGDLLVAAIDVRGQPRITAPSGWQHVRTDNNGSIVELATYIHIAAATEPANYTWGFSNAQSAAGAIVAVHGQGASPIGDSAGRINPKASIIVGPSSQADRTGSLVLAFFGPARATSVTPPLGMSEIEDIASSAGTYKATLEVAGGSAPAGPIGTLTATAAGTSASVAQVIVIRP